jgi:hypothetical protein
VDWRLKCLALHALNHFPNAHRFAHRLTGRYLQQITAKTLESRNLHLENFPGGIAMEFGVGRNLLVSLLLSRAGADHVFAYDLHRLATVEQVNHVAKQLGMKEIENLEDLSKHRITYVAPGDARKTGPDKMERMSSGGMCSSVEVEQMKSTFSSPVFLASPGAT